MKIRFGASTLFLAASAALMISGGAMAQDDAEASQGDAAHGKEVFERIGECIQCHGWDGAGLGKNPRSAGVPANLRETQLDTAGLKQIISCGIPGTAMPYHNRDAYRDPEVCFGMTLDDFEDGQAPNRGETFGNDDLDDLVAYIQETIQGAGETTLADCEEFFGRSDHPSCRTLQD